MALVDVATAAAQLGTTPRHVRALIRDRGLPFVRVGQLIRIDESDLSAWIAEHRRIHQAAS
jgi:excisionase family DNA binding protein